MRDVEYGAGAHSQVVMDTLAVSHDEESAQLLDGEHVMEWVQNVHARTRGALDPTSANPNRADAASASLIDASLVKLDGLLHVLHALTATWCAPRTPQPLAAAADARRVPPASFLGFGCITQLNTTRSRTPTSAHVSVCLHTPQA